MEYKHSPLSSRASLVICKKLNTGNPTFTLKERKRKDEVTLTHEVEWGLKALKLNK